MSVQLQDQIKAARDEAHAVCDANGGTSSACAVAWDTVEELQAEASHRRAVKESHALNSLQIYCETNPDAPECRVYED